MPKYTHTHIQGIDSKKYEKEGKVNQKQGINNNYNRLVSAGKDTRDLPPPYLRSGFDLEKYWMDSEMFG